MGSVSGVYRSLASVMGMACFSIDCTKHMDYTTIGRLFQGFAKVCSSTLCSTHPPLTHGCGQGGFWGVLENINCLDDGLLALIGMSHLE